MNGAQLHLMLNHLPVMGALFSLLLLAWSLIRRSAEIQKLALAIALLAGLKQRARVPHGRACRRGD